MDLGITKELDYGYDEALARVPTALRDEGFGVLTEIDVSDTLRRKLGVGFRRYRILGACNPSLAHEALQKDLGAGLLMPCNVVVYELDDGRTVVRAADPLQTAVVQASPRLVPFATAVREKIARVVSQL
jgi:uncharacterized protein (DUF302 family)